MDQITFIALGALAYCLCGFVLGITYWDKNQTKFENIAVVLCCTFFWMLIGLYK
jgi:hypothetical protein